MPTLRTRSSKGAALSHAEMDANFKQQATDTTAAYTTLLSDNRDTLEVSSDVTITLGPSSSMVDSETGDYEVTIRNTSLGTVVVAPSAGDTINGGASNVGIDVGLSKTFKLSNSGTGYITKTSNGEFTSGTVMVFHQAAAPVGWTKSTTNNDKALRVVSGSGGTSGGTHALSSPPSLAHTHTGPSHTHTMGNHTHTGPAHTHTGPSHVHTIAHTHAGPSHSHTGAAHTHAGPSHTHTGPSHTHDVLIPKEGWTTVTAVNARSFWSASSANRVDNRTLTSAADGTGNTGASGTANTGAASAANTGSGGTGNTGSSSAGTTGAEGTGNTGSSGTAASGAPSSNTSDASGTAASGSTTPTAFAPQYIDVIVCTKD